MLVEQNSRVALDLPARTVVMDKGRIVYDGASGALRDDPDKLEQLIGVVKAWNAGAAHALPSACAGGIERA